MEFLSEAWIVSYFERWKNTPSLIEGLNGFSALIEYGWDGIDKPSAFLRVVNGAPTQCYFASAPAAPDFIMKAKPEIWDKMRKGELSGRAALLSRKLKFQGSMITAMKFMTPFNASIELIGRV